MAKGVTRIEGFKECRETLQELSKTVQRNVGKRSILVPAGVIAAAIRAKAPVSSDPRDPTPGSLRDSVTVRPDKARKGVVSAVVLVEDPAAVPNEFGTHKMTANPFGRPAVDGARAAAGAAFAEALKGEVDAAVARTAKRTGKT
jgi:HK97 gp10 family phage protein